VIKMTDISYTTPEKYCAKGNAMTYIIEERFGDTWFESAYRDNLSDAQEHMAEIRNKAIGKGQSAALGITYDGKIVDEMECKKRGCDDTKK